MSINHSFGLRTERGGVCVSMTSLRSATGELRFLAVSTKTFKACLYSKSICVANELSHFCKRHFVDREIFFFGLDRDKTRQIYRNRGKSFPRSFSFSTLQTVSQIIFCVQSFSQHINKHFWSSVSQRAAVLL